MTTFNLDSHSVVVSKELETYNSIRLKYDKLANSLMLRFDLAYSTNFSDIDGLHENCSSIFYSQYLNKAIDEAIKDLVAYNIFDVNESVFIDKYLGGFFTWDDDWGKVDEKYLAIVLNAEELDDYRSSRREGRGKWVGGGFGLSGAIKGSLQAGAINLAAGAAHGAFNLAAKGLSVVGDTIKKEKLFDDPKTKHDVTAAVYLQIYWLHRAVVLAIIEKSSTRIHIPSSSDVDSAKSILENIQKDRVDASKIKELLAKAIALNPYNSSLYDCWFEKYMDSSGQLESIACFFGESTITDTKKKLLADFKASLRFSSPKDAQESWAKLENKAQQIGKPFSSADVIREKKRILSTYIDSLDFSTAPETEKNLPSLRAYAEAIDFLDEYEKQKIEIEQAIAKKALDLQEADKFTSSAKEIILLISAFFLFVLMILAVLGSLLGGSIKDGIVAALFAGGIAYACYRKVISVKGTKATNILHSLAHICVGIFAFAFGISIFSFFTDHAKASIFSTLMTPVIGGCFGWHFYDIAATRFKEQGITPKPQKFIIATISGLVISIALAGYAYFHPKNKEQSAANSATAAATQPAQAQPSVATSSVTEPLTSKSEQVTDIVQFSPSFDCAKARTGAERLICSNSELSALDVELVQAYQKLENSYSDSEKKALRKTEDAWLKNERDICLDTGCMSKAYQSRTEELELLSQNLSTSNSELPFVGKRSFDFMVGTDTGLNITIEENGNTKLESGGTENHVVIYEGAFSNPLLDKDKDGVFFKDGKVYAIHNGKVGVNCKRDNQECVSELYSTE